MPAPAPRGRPEPRPGAASPSPRALRGLAESFRVAWSGVVETAVHERNMRIHLVAGMLVALVASGVQLEVAEQLALLLCVFLVLASEVANSALEALVDLVTRERHDRARAAKDAGAAAVLVLAVGSVGVLAAVLVHAWPEIVRDRGGVLRQAAMGLPLAVVAAALLSPGRRPVAVDVALGAAGAVLLCVLATFTTSAVFTALVAVLFAVAVAVAVRRRSGRHIP